MPTTKVQSTPPLLATHAGSITFAAPPTPGNLVVIALSAYYHNTFDGGALTSLGDNQGNTYYLAVDSGDANEGRSRIYYAFNVTSAGGPFTISIVCNAGSTQFLMTAIEFSVLGLLDPLVGVGSAVNAAACATSATGAPEVALVAALTTFRLNFDVTGITVASVTPAWTQEYERLSTTLFTLAGEADSRVVSGSGAQAVSWSIASVSAGNPSCAIAAFYAAPPAALIRATQIGRQVLEQDSSANTFIRLTAVGRQVAYPFTCTPGPTNTPQPGCPAATTLDPPPVAAPPGCANDEPPA